MHIPTFFPCQVTGTIPADYYILMNLQKIVGFND